MSSSAVADVFQLAGTTLEGRFVVDRVVAEGGFGVVYHAQQAALERPIALKVLKTPARFDTGMGQHFLAGFAAEAKTIARIAHPSIVHVYDFGVSMMPSGVRAAWMALEWLTGTTLEEDLLRRREQGGRSPAECLDILRPILSALAMVHDEGVAHRDIKPANIMLVRAQGRTELKLLDFGIAKIMGTDEAAGSGHTHTRSSHVAFSPGYASPEQVGNGRSGPWTDVHAMGLVLTEMLTGRTPFDAVEIPLLIQQIVDRVRPTPAKFGVAVGPWESVLSRALAVLPAERYPDAGELLRALEARVGEASSAFASSPGATDSLGVGTEHALGAMSTLRAPESGPSRPPAQITSNGVAASLEPSGRANPRSRALAFFGGGALLLVVASVLGWSALRTRPPELPPAAVAVAPPIVAAAAAPPPGASAVERPSLPLPSSAASAEPTPAPPLTPDAAAPQRAPRRGSAPASPPAASAPPAKPAPSGRILIE